MTTDERIPVTVLNNLFVYFKVLFIFGNRSSYFTTFSLPNLFMFKETGRRDGRIRKYIFYVLTYDVYEVH